MHVCRARRPTRAYMRATMHAGLHNLIHMCACTIYIYKIMRLDYLHVYKRIICIVQNCLLYTYIYFYLHLYHTISAPWRDFLHPQWSETGHCLSGCVSFRKHTTNIIIRFCVFHLLSFTGGDGRQQSHGYGLAPSQHGRGHGQQHRRPRYQ